VAPILIPMIRLRFLLPAFLFLSLLFLDSCKKSADDEITYTYTIVPLQTIGFSSLPSAVQNQFFVRQLAATGGKPPYTWTLESGSLPTGLTLSPGGRISGTPAASGKFTYTVKLTDSKGTAVHSDFTQNISSSGMVTFLLVPPQIPAFGQSQDVGYLFLAQGGQLPWTFTITGLPAGVTYDPLTGLISGTPSQASSGNITITLKDANGTEASGSPVTVTFAVNAPVPSGGGGGGGGGATGCPSIYDGTYMGEFKYVYYVKGQDENYSPVQGGLQVTLKLKCLATAGGSTVLYVTHVVCSDANFGCQLGGCTPQNISVATLPASPPTNSSNPSTAGQGILIYFPNGSMLATTNTAGALNVTSDGRTLSNSLDPSIQKSTWMATGGSFPSSSVPPGGPVTEFKSWVLTWSNTDK
jgi:large repetitive protein